MDAQILHELEIAAQILLAPPNIVTNEQREAAESVFLNLKKTKSPYGLCKYILETSKVDYVLFEAAGLIKDAIIREWTFLEESWITSLKQYLLQYVTERSGTLPAFVREKILQVISIIVKRASVKDEGEQTHLLLNEIENLILNGDHSRRLLGCGLLASMMQEYAITKKSSDIFLKWEEHCSAKEQFERTELKRIFQFCCRALNSLTNAEPANPEESLALFKQLLAISESVLTWSFTNSAKACEKNISLKLNSQWKDAVLESQVVNLFFTIYWKIRSNPQLSHHALTCLVQLASLDGTIFENERSQVEYLTNYIESFIKLTKSVEILDREALGVSEIVTKLLLILSPALTESIPAPLLQSFLEQLTILTCKFAEGAATEETMCVDDQLYMEAFDDMMKSWLHVLRRLSVFWNQYCVGALVQIFNVYLKCHLAPPEGTRGEGRDLEQEELDESEETDRVRFKDQLQTIGEFGRHCPEHCLPLLARILEDRTKQLRDRFDKLHRQQAASISDSSSLILLFEDIHWLLLISGNVIVVEAPGENTSVPSKLMNYSIAKSSSTSIETTLQVFGSPNRNLDEIQDAEQKTDHVIRIVSAVLRLSYLFKGFIEAKMVQFVSPEVVSSVLWFLGRWARVYLLMKEQPNTDLSMPFICCFGRDSEGGAWAVNFLLEQVVIYLVHFNSEPGVIRDTVDLFVSLVNSKEKGDCVLKSENLRSIILMQSNLPRSVQKDVFRGITLAAAAFRDSASRNEYLDQILKPLQTRLLSLLNQENFSRISHEEHVKLEILQILECVEGVALGSYPFSVPSIFLNLSPVLYEFPNITRIYHNYQQIVESVLTVLKNVTDYFHTYLSPPDCKKLYEVCLGTIQEYVKWNSGRLSLESNSQDDSFADILLLIKLLMTLFRINFTDVFVNENKSESVVDVCLYGLSIIMPLMTVDLLKYPTLCLEYYSLIKCASEVAPGKVFLLPENLLKTLLMSVEMGLRSFGEEIVSRCCKLIESLCHHCCKLKTEGETPHQALKPFLKLLLDLVLSGQMSFDVLPETSCALYGLILCYEDEYRTVVQNIIDGQTEPAVKDRLAKAFNNLTQNISVKFNKSSRSYFLNMQRFLRNFDEFYLNVRGFFMVK